MCSVARVQSGHTNSKKNGLLITNRIEFKMVLTKIELNINTFIAADAWFILLISLYFGSYCKCYYVCVLAVTRKKEHRKSCQLQRDRTRKLSLTRKFVVWGREADR